MIGVLCSSQERLAVAEFFELFKTPWSFYEDERNYEVLIVTAETEYVRLDAGVIVAFGSRRTWIDEQLGLETGTRRDGGAHELRASSTALPVSGPVLALVEDGDGVIARCDDGSPAALRRRAGNVTVIRCGYDLFAEVERLLVEGQAPALAQTPTLDLHIELLRRWLVAAVGFLVEIPPVRDGHPYGVCLTHDIDFLALRRHRLDRTLVGFLYRATVGSVRDLATGRASVRGVLRNWAAVITLPLVYLGLIDDPWQPFSSYAAADGAGSTFFVIPFRGRGGDGLDEQSSRRRRVGYDVDDVEATLQNLHADGFEIAVHGIDGWNSSRAGRAELDRVGQVIGNRDLGVRTHWLCADAGTPVLLEQAGYAYDATCGFNDAVGFKAGTTQVFRPLGVDRLLELPLHVQDTALFYPARMNLSEQDAWAAVESLRSAVRRDGGILTVSWHDRSLAPERLWDRFYARLLDALRADGAWFGTAAAVVEWFRLRRSVTFGRVGSSDSAVTVELRAANALAATAGLVLRVHQVDEAGVAITIDMPWSGEGHVEIPLPAGRESGLTVR